MGSKYLARLRRRFSYTLLAIVVLGLVWFFMPGIPVLFGPRASAATKAAGQAIFEHTWVENDPLAGGDGLGPVFNGRSCVACHFQGGVGGAGTNEHNVLAFEVRPTRRDPELHAGLVHKSAVGPAWQESFASLRRLFPVVPGGQRVVSGCVTTVRDFDPVRTEEVNTTALFGAGWIDRISPRSITHAAMGKSLAKVSDEFQLQFEGMPAGRPRVLPGGRVGKFGWKAQFASLDEFVAAACANEVGLGNPLMEQARPLGRTEYPSAKRDLGRKQFGQLVAFVDTLPRPTQVLPADPNERAASSRGEQLFHSVGCAFCHTPDMGGVKGLYSDFLLHVVENPASTAGYSIDPDVDVPLPGSHPRPEEWKTPPLWGVADSAPYFHDGGSPTLRDAIVRHQGSAAGVTEAYSLLVEADRAAIVAFLRTLKAPANATPLGNVATAGEVALR